jgi:long-subunit fatty acid transport protein
MGGLQAWTVPGSASAAYFNPALLTDSATSVQLGLVVIAQQIGISLDQRPGPEFDVAGLFSGWSHADFSPIEGLPISTSLLRNGAVKGQNGATTDLAPRPRQGGGTGQHTYGYMGFGLVVKGFKDHLAIGVNGLVPFGSFTTINPYFNDEREQYFSNSLHPELYSDRLTAPSIAFGAGVKVTDDLSLGVGATLSLKALAAAQAYVASATELSKILLAMTTEVSVSLVPHFGASYLLANKRLRLSATAHPPQKVEFNTAFSFLLGSGAYQQSGAIFVLNYTPWIATAGASFDFVHSTRETLTVAGTVIYATWSDYINRHGETPSPAYGWSDTLSPVLGARYRLGSVSMLADVSYVPTPVPPQTGRTNYVDNDRISTSLGGEYAFQMFGVPWHVGLQFQPHVLLERHQYKLPTPIDGSGRNLAPQLVKDEVPDDALRNGAPVPNREGLQTNNPGWPGFSSSGVIMAGSVYFRAEL